MKLEADVRRTCGNFHLNAQMKWSGGLLGVMGPSGGGKTTWLHALAGLVRPEHGRIVLDGEVLFDQERRIWTPPHQRRVGVVFQDDRLWPHRSVRGNVMYGYRRTPRGMRCFEPEQVIDWLGLQPLLDRRVANLSGGEKRRVGLARALLMSPRLLLLDEPTSGLDEAMSDRVLALIGSTVAAAGIPTIMVSHHVSHLLRLTDELLVMHEGRVLAQGPSSVAASRSRALGLPADIPTINRLPVVVRDHLHERGMTELEVADGDRECCDEGDEGKACGDARARLRSIVSNSLAVGDRATALLPSNQIVLSLAPVETVSMQNRIRGRVVDVIETDDRVICVVDVGVRLLAQITRQARDDFAIRRGMAIWCLFKATAVKVYPSWEPSDRPSATVQRSTDTVVDRHVVLGPTSLARGDEDADGAA